MNCRATASVAIHHKRQAERLPYNNSVRKLRTSHRNKLAFA